MYSPLLERLAWRPHLHHRCFFFFQISSRKVLTLRCLSADIVGKHRALDWILNVFRVVYVGFLDNCTKMVRKPCWWTFLWRFWPQKCQNANVVESTTQHYAGFYLYAWSKCNHSCKLARGRWSVRACFFDSIVLIVALGLYGCLCVLVYAPTLHCSLVIRNVVSTRQACLVGFRRAKPLAHLR